MCLIHSESCIFSSSVQKCQLFTVGIDRKTLNTPFFDSILLIPTNSRKWMKAFRKALFPCYGPTSEEKYPWEWIYSPSLMIVATFTMLVYLQSLQRCPVQNKEIRFYKWFIRGKKSKYQIWILKRNCYLEYI